MKYLSYILLFILILGSYSCRDSEINNIDSINNNKLKHLTKLPPLEYGVFPLTSSVSRITQSGPNSAGWSGIILLLNSGYTTI